MTFSSVSTSTQSPEAQFSELDLHSELHSEAVRHVEEIDGPTVSRHRIVDGLLDIRNISRGRDLGIELTVDDMLESLPAGRTVSSEWWMSCLDQFADHANYLAAGYPPIGEPPHTFAA